ncbi:hypothetical protein [Microbacterium lacus]|uniref:hypothetical protein n=1 Tax=Microbacterium lacus TaxID=415217 RepID=UPI000C2CCF78|nr:hypothetical protein [Microbacterium lacus]
MRTTVYVAHWPQLGIVKVGQTILPSRVRRHERNGAQILALIHNATTDLEHTLLAVAAKLGPRAFKTWRDAVPTLGAGGIGFTECFELGPGAITDLMEAVHNADSQH